MNHEHDLERRLNNMEKSYKLQLFILFQIYYMIMLTGFYITWPTSGCTVFAIMILVPWYAFAFAS